MARLTWASALVGNVASAKTTTGAKAHLCPDRNVALKGRSSTLLPAAEYTAWVIRVPNCRDLKNIKRVVEDLYRPLFQQPAVPFWSARYCPERLVALTITVPGTRLCSPKQSTEFRTPADRRCQSTTARSAHRDGRVDSLATPASPCPQSRLLSVSRRKLSAGRTNGVKYER